VYETLRSAHSHLGNDKQNIHFSHYFSGSSQIAWVTGEEPQPCAVEEDGGLEVLEAAQSLDGLDLRVEPLGNGIHDAVNDK